jgi:hypothetical protein
LPVPTEAQEQMAFVQYLRARHIKHFRVPSETYTKSWAQKAKNKALGVVRGVPDLFILTPTGLIAIEMKRVKGGTTSPEQKEWIAGLNEAGTPAYVAKGAEEAIAIVEQHIPRKAVEF